MASTYTTRRIQEAATAAKLVAEGTAALAANYRTETHIGGAHSSTQVAVIFNRTTYNYTQDQAGTWRLPSVGRYYLRGTGIGASGPVITDAAVVATLNATVARRAAALAR